MYANMETKGILFSEKKLWVDPTTTLIWKCKMQNQQQQQQADSSLHQQQQTGWR